MQKLEWLEFLCHPIIVPLESPVKRSPFGEKAAQDTIFGFSTEPKTPFFLITRPLESNFKNITWFLPYVTMSQALSGLNSMPRTESYENDT